MQKVKKSTVPDVAVPKADDPAPDTGLRKGEIRSREDMTPLEGDYVAWFVAKRPAVYDENRELKRPEQSLDLYQITLIRPDEVVQQRGMRAVPNTGLTAKFQRGIYRTKYQEEVDLLMASEDWMLKIWPHPEDPTGYWQSIGVLKEETKTETKLEINNQASPKVVRGAISTSVRAAEVPA